MRYVLRTDGSTEQLPRPVNMKEAAKLIGALVLDIVPLRHLGRPMHVMLVNDRGYETRIEEREDGVTELVPTKALYPVNRAATKLYHANCVPGTTHEIVGDVIVCPDEDYD
jgi:hypothetical protein